MEHFPATGGALVVSNHSGGMFTPDVLVFAVLSLRLHRAVSADAEYRWVNVANWETEEHFRAAHASNEFRAAVTAPGWENFPSSPMLYQVVTEASASDQ